MQTEHPILTARCIGPCACSGISQNAVGTVFTVFQSVIYIAFGSNLIAVTCADIAPGPINLTTNAARDVWRKSGHTIGQSARVLNGLLYIGGTTKIDLASADIWQPSRPAFTSPDRLILALGHLDALCPNAPAEGYGRTIGRHNDPDVVAATHALDQLYQGNERTMNGLTRLLGRGPGLTPAGDDFLGGAMIGLHGIGQNQMAARLWSHLKPLVNARTGPISAALLTAAAEGMGSDGLHRVLQALLLTENLSATLAELDQIGHSSGWDAFAGLVLAIRTHARYAEPVPA